MKTFRAGREFRFEDEAVAGALATALLVGVVVLVSVAATVIFKEVAASSGDVVMPVQFVSDDGQDRLVVAKADDVSTWNRVGLRLENLNSAGFGLCVGDASDATPTRYFNENPSATCFGGANRMTVAGNELVLIDRDLTRISANSYLAFCGERDVFSAQLKIVDLQAGATMANLNFGNVRACGF